MANLKNMRNLVALIKGANDESVTQFKLDNADEVGGILSDTEYHSALIEKEESIRLFINRYGVDEQKARDIYGDATSKRFAYLQERRLNDLTQRADVTSDGRGLILKRLGDRIPTGLWREIIEKLWPMTATLTAVIACMAAVASAVVAYYVYRHG